MKKSKSRIRGKELKVGVKVFVVQEVSRITNKNQLCLPQKEIKNKKIKSKEQKHKNIRILAEIVDVSQIEITLVGIEIYGGQIPNLLNSERLNIAKSGSFFLYPRLQNILRRSFPRFFFCLFSFLLELKFFFFYNLFVLSH